MKIKLFSGKEKPLTPDEERMRKIELDRQRKESLVKMESFSKSVQKAANDMAKAEKDIYAKALEAARKGLDAESKRMLKAAAGMRKYERNLSGFKTKVDLFIIKAKAYQSISNVSNLIAGVNGFLGQCPNLNTLIFDMQNMDGMLKSMDSALDDLLSIFTPEDELDEFSEKDQDFEDLQRQLMGDLAKEGAPVGVSANNESKIDAEFGNIDALARMLDEERGN